MHQFLYFMIFIFFSSTNDFANPNSTLPVISLATPPPSFFYLKILGLANPAVWPSGLERYSQIHVESHSKLRGSNPARGYDIDRSEVEIRFPGNCRSMAGSEPLLQEADPFHLKLNVELECWYKIADRLLLLKCYDNKMVKLLGCSFIGASSWCWPTTTKKTIYLLQSWNRS